MLLLLAGRSLAATLTVGPSGAYATIADAEAAAVDGDRIELEAGVWTEGLRPAGKALTYAGTGATLTGLDPGLLVEGGETVTVEGLTFSACVQAVVVTNGGTVVVIDGVFEDGACEDGCAVEASRGASVTVIGSTFTDNAGTSRGGSIFVTSGAALVVSDSTFTGGSADYGGEIAALSGASVSVTDTRFSSATARTDGGALWISGGSALTLDGVTIEAASAVDGAGAYISDVATTFTDVVFLANTATGSGGGAYVVGSHAYGLSVVVGEYAGNAAGGSGGGLYVNDAEPVDLAAVVFDANTADDGAGAFLHGNYGSYGPTTIDACRFVDNVATARGGGVLSQYTASLEVSSSAFLANSAGSEGGGLYSADDAVWMAGSAFLENAAANAGGGGYVSTGTFEAENVGWACNVAGGTGGGLAVTASTVTITANVATGNDLDGFGIGASSFTASYNLAWDNVGNAWSGVTDPTGSDGNVAADPIVRSLTCDGDPTGDDLAPRGGSPLVDVAPGVDDDGTTADVGAYGGTWGATLDVDGDGWTYWNGDCDDGRDDVHPLATEAWYDGIDQDCDGSDDDQDGDGYVLADDCDDTDASVYPGATETWYDGVDQDCDGSDDDQDGDGYLLADDCDDTDAAAYPGNAETWYDGIDGDCAGDDDFDQDADGWPLDDDCDDTDAAIYPGASEAWYDGIDADCGGEDDFDRDGDGATVDADCDDADPSAYPGAAEVWYDGVDEDCAGDDDFDGDADGSPTPSDCDDADPSVYPGADDAWYDGIDADCGGEDDDDQDGDGTPLARDCDDTDPAVYPGAPDDWYDGVDADCGGEDDYDQDGDGERSRDESAGDDCDDLDPAVHPGADETWYDGVDQDCDGSDDDQDGDGYGVAVDCDDVDAGINPAIAEVWYDGVDQDCDGADDDQDGDGLVAADDCDDTDGSVQRCLRRIDGGCDTGGGSPAALLAALGAAAVARRAHRSSRRSDPKSRRSDVSSRRRERSSTRSLTYAAALATALFPARSHALDATGAGRFPVRPGGLARVSGLTAGDAGELDVAVVGGWAGTTAEATYDDGSKAPLMSGLTTLDVGIGWTFLDRVRVEAGLPVVLGASVPEALGPGVGDAWVDAQWAAFGEEAASIGPMVELSVPTGSPERLSGGGGLGGAILAAAGGRTDRLAWGVELGGGVRAVGAYQAFAFTSEPELRFGGGARLRVAGPVALGLEARGHLGLGAENEVVLATSGAEGLLSAAVAVSVVDVVASGGVGLVDGVGTPDARALLTVRTRIPLSDARPRAGDADRDHVPDDRDGCLSAAEDPDGYQDGDGCPDLDDDADGIADADDACRTDPEDRDGWKDDDGCPDTDDDGDGLADGYDHCPRLAGPAETNGCPDRDRDGLLDGADRCPDDPLAAGTDLAHTDGCPGRVAVFPDRLQLTETVRFDAGRATLRPESAALIVEIADTLKRWPDLPVVEIGAHVDGAGDAAANLRLTQARAEAVQRALVAAGVPAARLVAVGYGASRPLAPEDTEDGRERNRRVEFVFVRR